MLLEDSNVHFLKISVAVMAFGISYYGPKALGQTNPPGWETAVKALQVLGADIDGSSGRCASCHGIGRTQLREWAETTMMTSWTCLASRTNNGVDLGSGEDEGNPFPPPEPPSALDQINCLRTDSLDPSSDFDLSRMGIYAAGAHTSYFTSLFRQAYPNDQDYELQYSKFVADVGMPMNASNLMPEEDFQTVLQWTLQNMPLMERVLGLVGPPPTSCETNISDDLKVHIAQLEISGWQAKNLEQNIAMFGCEGNPDPRECFQQRDVLGRDLFPDVRDTPLGAEWTNTAPGAKFRILRFLNYGTSYWMRSSADGRFVGNGYSGPPPRGSNSENDPDFSGIISDLNPLLTPGAAYRDILVAASFDPSFFPDNSGFMFQGTLTGTGICHQSLLENLGTERIVFDEAECASSTQVSLYQAVGASLDGGDYLAVSGPFNSDYGSGNVDETPYWGEGGNISFTPFIHDGESFTPSPLQTLWTPYLGDWNISPSTKIVIGRMEGATDTGRSVHMGYRLQFVDKQPTVDASGLEFALRDAATICLRGAKGKISFDERMYTTYHYPDSQDWREYGYQSAEDPEFLRRVAQGSADIYIVDLLTGRPKRITNMGPGQYAMFPHYRSDGWLYFMVWDKFLDRRFVAATDASIMMAAGEL